MKQESNWMRSLVLQKRLINIAHTSRSLNLTRTVDLCKEFQEEAYSVALHPTGLFILVGFSDKLRLMNLLINDIRIFREFTLRGCREVSWTVFI